jgi:hypothetical protein
MDLVARVYSVCFLLETLPVSLSGFIHICTPLPCPMFLTTCPSHRVYTVWYDTVAILLDPKQHPSRHTRQLHLLRLQLDATVVPLSVEDGVQPICDPDRTRFLSELIDGTYIHRQHLQHLLRHAEDTVAIEQTTYMTEAILDQFPPGGLETESIQDLVTLYLYSSVVSTSSSSPLNSSTHNSLSES